MTRGGGDEMLGLRVMREGDDPRDIYWRRSTHPVQRIIIERSREVRAKVALVLDNLYVGDAPSEEFNTQFERRVREVASRSVAHLRRGDRVTIESRSGQRTVASPEGGADVVLRFLALIDAEQAEGPPSVAHVRRASIDPGLEPLPAPLQFSVIPAVPQLSRPAAIPAVDSSSADVAPPPPEDA